MAKLNKKIFADNDKVREDAKKECGMYLQACLTNEEMVNLKNDWEESGRKKPWWQFCFDNISVFYRPMERELVKERTEEADELEW